MRQSANRSTQRRPGRCSRMREQRQGGDPLRGVGESAAFSSMLVC